MIETRLLHVPQPVFGFIFRDPLSLDQNVAEGGIHTLAHAYIATDVYGPVVANNASHRLLFFHQDVLDIDLFLCLSRKSYVHLELVAKFIPVCLRRSPVS